MSFTYEFEMASIAADMIIFRYYNKENIQVLLIERGGEPFKGYQSLPGGFVERNERTLAAAIRELKEEVNLIVPNLTFVGIADKPDRDPRQRTLSCLYSCVISDKLSETIKAGDDAAAFKWVNVKDIVDGTVELAFDHYEIVTQTVKQLGSINYVE